MKTGNAGDKLRGYNNRTPRLFGYPPRDTHEVYWEGGITDDTHNVRLDGSFTLSEVDRRSGNTPRVDTIPISYSTTEEIYATWDFPIPSSVDYTVRKRRALIMYYVRSGEVLTWRIRKNNITGTILYDNAGTVDINTTYELDDSTTRLVLTVQGTETGMGTISSPVYVIRNVIFTDTHTGVLTGNAGTDQRTPVLVGDFAQYNYYPDWDDPNADTIKTQTAMSNEGNSAPKISGVDARMPVVRGGLVTADSHRPSSMGEGPAATDTHDTILNGSLDTNIILIRESGLPVFRELRPGGRFGASTEETLFQSVNLGGTVNALSCVYYVLFTDLIATERVRAFATIRIRDSDGNQLYRRTQGITDGGSAGFAQRFDSNIPTDTVNIYFSGNRTWSGRGGGIFYRILGLRSTDSHDAALTGSPAIDNRIPRMRGEPGGQSDNGVVGEDTVRVGVIGENTLKTQPPV